MEIVQNLSSTSFSGEMTRAEELDIHHLQTSDILSLNKPGISQRITMNEAQGQPSDMSDPSDSLMDKACLIHAQGVSNVDLGGF